MRAYERQSHARLLAEALLDRPIRDWLSDRRPTISWRRIAQELAETTGGKVDVTPETLRLWFEPDPPKAKAG